MRIMLFGWSPGIGDPTVYGWVTVVAYALATWWCWSAARAGPGRERRFWLILCGIMAFLCVNKQLDLQTLLTDAGRSISKAQGWYGVRREWQLFFMIVLGGLALATAVGMLAVMRRSRWPILGAIAGLAMLLTFVMLRAASFEKMDQLIGNDVAGVPVNNLMELGGIAIVAVCAMAARQGAGRPARR